MTALKAIRRHGFRKWYERELLQSHANLVLLLLATVGLLACAEIYTVKLALADQLQVLLSAAASAAIGLLALRRYLYLLNHAEFVANQAECARCKTYARWTLVEEASAETLLQVRCKHCGNEWKIAV
jgi:hypothetical protein